MKNLLIMMIVFGTLDTFACNPKREICVGEKVITNRGIEGEVISMGLIDALVDLKDVDDRDYIYYYTERFLLSSLARTKGCGINGLCVGDKVIGRHGVKGTIAGIFKKRTNIAKGSEKLMVRRTQNFLGWLDRVLADQTSSSDYVIMSASDITKR